MNGCVRALKAKYFGYTLVIREEGKSWLQKQQFVRLYSILPIWIDLGQPDEKRIKKVCGRSERVIIYTYQEGMGFSLV